MSIGEVDSSVRVIAAGAQKELAQSPSIIAEGQSTANATRRCASFAEEAVQESVKVELITHTGNRSRDGLE